MVLIVIILIAAAICLYRKIVAQANASKNTIPKAVIDNPDFDDMNLEKQYTPNAIYEAANRASEGGFGGKDFDRSKMNMNDDVIGWTTSKIQDTESAIVDESALPGDDSIEGDDI